MAIQDGDLFVVGRGKDVKAATGKELKSYLDGEFINQAGDSMSGELNVQYPTDDDHASSKEYVDQQIFKIQNELDDIGSNLSNGTFDFKNPGTFSPPSAGEFLLLNGSNNTTNTVADAVVFCISHTNREGEAQMFDDMENGYIQLKVGGSGQKATYTVNGILFSNASYSQMDVSYHAGNTSSLPNNSICYVNTLHIDGIDLNDLEQALDDRYVKLRGDSEILGTVNISTSPGTVGIKLDPAGEITAKLFKGDASEMENFPSDVVHVSEFAPPNPNQGELWFNTDDARLYVTVNDVGDKPVWVDTSHFGT